MTIRMRRRLRLMKSRNLCILGQDTVFITSSSSTALDCICLPINRAMSVVSLKVESAIMQKLVTMSRQNAYQALHK